MKHLEITLRSGTVLTVDATDWTVERLLLGGLAKLEWTTPDGFKRKLVFVALDQIDAIVEIDE